MADAKFFLVNYPREAGFASIHCATSRGTVHISAAAGGAVSETGAQPLSPAYHLNNAAGGRNLTIPLGANAGKPETVAVTFVNDSRESADASVVVAVSFLPQENQGKVNEDLIVPAGKSAFVHIVFNPVG